MSPVKDITIIGAGPFGMSIAAHLQRHRLDYSIIGKPMHAWRTNMPKGMMLKSPGFASSLSDPDSAFTLQGFCETHRLPYGEIDFPISADTFCAYGEAFYQHFIAGVEQADVTSVAACAEGFALRLANDSVIKSRRVVVAVGLAHFRRMPAALTGLPANLYSHSADHHALDRFKGKNVAVLGSGSSAIDLAVLLEDAGASVVQIVRRPVLDYGSRWQVERPTLWRRIREPMSKIGPGWRSRLCTDFPWMFRYFTDRFRLETVRTHLGPSGAWFLKERGARIKQLAGYHLRRATESGGRAQLQLVSESGKDTSLEVDHVIAATGYDHDVDRVPFLAPGILRRINLIGKSPRLSSRFESSVPGLYFVGPIAAASFGPVMRFVAGCDFTARRIVSHFVHAQAPRPHSGLPKLRPIT